MFSQGGSLRVAQNAHLPLQASVPADCLVSFVLREGDLEERALAT